MLLSSAAKTAARRRPPLSRAATSFLILDGYSPEGRADLEAGGATTAGRLYDRMLRAATPGPVETQICYPADGGELPDPRRFDGVAWTGCSLTIYAQEERVQRQIAFARDVFAAGVPSFGSCWAAQIAAVAAGGVCAAHPHGREMGVARKIKLTPAGRAHPMYAGKPDVFDAFISHDDEVTHLPPGGSLLASNAHSVVQACSVVHGAGVFWAVQYHPEYDLREVARLMHCRRAKLIGLGFFRSMDEADEHIEDLETLHGRPDRADLAWRLGIDADVMNADVRTIEVRNWVEQQVLPYGLRRTAVWA